MQLVHEESLGDTLNACEELFFWNKPVEKEAAEEVALWIASRHDLPGAYNNTFAPTEGEAKQPWRCFIGDEMRLGGGRQHILGEESSRALFRLGVDLPKVQKALTAANQQLAELIDPSKGFYCCYYCTVGMWRNLAWGGLDHSEERLANGMEILREHRLVAGNWQGFPFWYTLHALWDMVETGLGKEDALAEFAWVAPYLKRRLQRLKSWEPWISRRAELANRILNTVIVDEVEELAE